MPPDRRIEVLYVEDSAGDALLTGEILAEALPDVRLTIARDGLQALMILSQREFQPALIILDLNIPVLSGFDVLERNPRKDIPIVIFSVSMRERDAEQTLSLGAREYVQKPMDMAGYRDAVVGMIRKWAMRGPEAGRADAPRTRS
jgi:CheY-like chemotaxis protein